jgi:hypothetical protein
VCRFVIGNWHWHSTNWIWNLYVIQDKLRKVLKGCSPLTVYKILSSWCYKKLTFFFNLFCCYLTNLKIHSIIFCRGSNLAILSMKTQLKNRIDPENTFGKPPMTYCTFWLIYRNPMRGRNWRKINQKKEITKRSFFSTDFQNCRLISKKQANCSCLIIPTISLYTESTDLIPKYLRKYPFRETISIAKRLKKGTQVKCIPDAKNFLTHDIWRPLARLGKREKHRNSVHLYRIYTIFKKFFNMRCVGKGKKRGGGI